MNDKPSWSDRFFVAWLALWGRPVMFGFSGTITVDELDDLEIRRRGGMYITWGRVTIKAPAGTRIGISDKTRFVTKNPEAAN